MIYYDYKKSLSAEESHTSLVRVFGESAPSRATVGNWFREFSRGRESLEDEPRSGRPVTAVTRENIDATRRMIEEDPHITFSYIEGTLNIGSTAAQTIVHEHLGLTKRCARWVPHSLTEAQKDARVDWCHFMLEKFDGGRSKDTYNIVTGDETWVYHYDPETKRQSSVWCFPDEAPPTKVRRSRSSGKKMVASFFTKRGHLTTVPLDNRRTVNAEWYVTECLPKVIASWKTRHPRSKPGHLMLHHDNASAHRAARTVDFLEKEKVRVLPHPAYSPDLAPCDFFLFPKTKEKIRGQRFSSNEEAITAYESALLDIPEEAWIETFSKWFQRMEKCIRLNGEYFEKL